MEKPKFTPGPWCAAWSKWREGVFIVQAGQPTNRVLASFDGDGDGPDETSLADAHLIAAAPDLYAAARLGLNYIENTEAELGIQLSSGDALRAALSKANGESGT